MLGEEIRQIREERDVERFGTLDNSERMIAVPGDVDDGHKRRNRKRIKYAKRI